MPKAFGGMTAPNTQYPLGDYAPSRGSAVLAGLADFARPSWMPGNHLANLVEGAAQQNYNVQQMQAEATKQRELQEYHDAMVHATQQRADSYGRRVDDQYDLGQRTNATREQMDRMRRILPFVSQSGQYTPELDAFVQNGGTLPDISHMQAQPWSRGGLGQQRVGSKLFEDTGDPAFLTNAAGRIYPGSGPPTIQRGGKMFLQGNQADKAGAETANLRADKPRIDANAQVAQNTIAPRSEAPGLKNIYTDAQTTDLQSRTSERDAMLPYNQRVKSGLFDAYEAAAGLHGSQKKGVDLGLPYVQPMLADKLAGIEANTGLVDTRTKMNQFKLDHPEMMVTGKGTSTYHAPLFRDSATQGAYLAKIGYDRMNVTALPNLNKWKEKRPELITEIPFEGWKINKDADPEGYALFKADQAAENKKYQDIASGKLPVPRGFEQYFPWVAGAAGTPVVLGGAKGAKAAKGGPFGLPDPSGFPLDGFKTPAPRERKTVKVPIVRKGAKGKPPTAQSLLRDLGR